MPDLDAALKMIDVFVALGATHFDLSVIRHVRQGDGRCFDVRVPGQQLTKASVGELRFKLLRVLTETDAKQYSLILRPRPVAGLLWVQLDDLDAENVDRIWRYAFLVIRTSPGGLQAWIALREAPNDRQIIGDFILRLRRGVGADLQATGASRLAGSRNFKPKYQSIDFPIVQVVRAEPVFASYPELDRTGIATLAVERQSFRAQPVRSNAARRWPCMEDVFRTAPQRKDGSGLDRSHADGFWCKWSAERGWSVEDVANKLPEVSDKAREEIARGNTRYPWDKAKWGFRAAGFRVPDEFPGRNFHLSTSVSPEPEVPPPQPELEPDWPEFDDDWEPANIDSTVPASDSAEYEAAGGIAIPPDLAGLIDLEIGITPELIALIADPGNSAGTAMGTGSGVESVETVSPSEAGKPSADRTAIPADLAALIDPASRIEVDELIRTLSATVTHVIPRGARDPSILRGGASCWKEWEQQRLKRIFAQGRMSVEDINRVCWGYSPSLQAKELYDWAERYAKALEKRNKEAWQVQREAGRTWARWERFRREKPAAADAWRRQHQDPAGGDLLWMLRFAKPVSAEVRRAVEGALERYTIQLKTPSMPTDVVASSGSVSESAADVVKHIDPETGIRPIAEWGIECGRGVRAVRRDDGDTHLPQHAMREIVILTHLGTVAFMGRWLAQYLDLATGVRHSIAQRADGAFVTIAKHDHVEPVEMRVFRNLRAIRDGDLPFSLQSAAGRARSARSAPQLEADQRMNREIVPKDQPPDPDPPKHPVPPPTAACGICGCRNFWRGVSGGFVCCRCTPPSKSGVEVEAWWSVVPEIGEDWK